MKKINSKKILFFILSISLLGFYACNKDESMAELENTQPKENLLKSAKYNPTIQVSMSIKLIIKQVKGGIEEQQIVPEANLMQDLGCDGLDIYEIIAALEDFWDITITDTERDFVFTVLDLQRLVEKKLNE